MINGGDLNFLILKERRERVIKVSKILDLSRVKVAIRHKAFLWFNHYEREGKPLR